MVARSLLLAAAADGSAAGLNGRSLRLLLLLVLVLLLGPCIAVAPLAAYPQVPHTMAEEDSYPFADGVAAEAEEQLAAVPAGVVHSMSAAVPAAAVPAAALRAAAAAQPEPVRPVA